MPRFIEDKDQNGVSVKVWQFDQKRWNIIHGMVVRRKESVEDTIKFLEEMPLDARTRQKFVNLVQLRSSMVALFLV